MVRETRHLWVGNLPDNIREDRIREHFKRYGRVQSVKLLPRGTKEEASEGQMACTVAFMDIKSASKAHNAEHKLDDRTLTTEYYEPAAIPSAASPQNTPSSYTTSPGSTRFPNGHGSTEEHAAFGERFYDRTNNRVTDGEFIRRTSTSYHDARGRNRDRSYRNGPYNAIMDRSHRTLANSWSSPSSANNNAATTTTAATTTASTATTTTAAATTTATTTTAAAAATTTTSSSSTSSAYNNSDAVAVAASSANTTSTNSSSSSSSSVRYNSSQNETGYASTPSESNERQQQQQQQPPSAAPSQQQTTQRSSTGGGDQQQQQQSASTKKPSPSSSSKTTTKSRSGSRSPSPSGSTSSRSPSRSRSRSTSSSSSSSTSRDTSSSGDRRPLAICVKNLPLRSSDTSLKDGLFHEYKKHGKVTWVKVVGQNTERYAIVCFKKPEDVEKALEVSYDKLFFGCKIEVEPYQGCDVEDNDLRPYEAEIDEFHPKATRTLFIGNLEKDVTASDLRKHFDQFGEIIEIDIKKQGAVGSYAFCQYADIVSVVKAIRMMDGEHLGNNRIKLGFGKSMPTNCVWVDGVAENVNEKYLRMQFEQSGVIGKVHFDRDKGQALIFYEQVVAAQLAVNKMRGFTIKGNKIQVDFASRECQESFFEHLEKQGVVADRTPVERFEDTRGVRESSSTRGGFEAVSARFSRYETPTRPRTSSYSRSGVVAVSGAVSASSVGVAMPSPGTPGSVTPRGSGSSRSSRARFEYYEAGAANASGDYPGERTAHFRSYDEFSQGSGHSHDDPAYEPHDCYPYNNHGSPQLVAEGGGGGLIVVDASSRSSAAPLAGVIGDHPGGGVMPSFAQPGDIRNLQKERVHLLEQLEECPSSGDELMSPKKRLKLELLDVSGALIGTSDVIIEANRDHRKVMEVRRLSEANLKGGSGGHHGRRPSVDGGKHGGHGYLPHAVCKRRKTASSDSGSRHHYDHHSGPESVGGSRPGTPLVDERPEQYFPSEPRRTPRDRDGPLTLPLPRFAAQIMNHRGGVSIQGIKGQKGDILSSPPPASVTSPRISNSNHHQPLSNNSNANSTNNRQAAAHQSQQQQPPQQQQQQQQPPSPVVVVHVPPPASPPPRPPSLSSNSSDSDAAGPPSPSLDERIRSLDEKYEKWSGSRALSAAGGEALAKLDATRERFRLRHNLLDLDLKEVQPSEIVKSVMAKRSVFDEDLKRLENAGEKYEPKEFGGMFQRVTAMSATTVPQQPLVGTVPPPTPTTPQSAPPVLMKQTPLPIGGVAMAPVVGVVVVGGAQQAPKTPTMLSPRSAGAVIPAKGLQYPFPSHPPMPQPSTPVVHPPPTLSGSSTPCSASVTSTPPPQLPLSSPATPTTPAAPTTPVTVVAPQPPLPPPPPTTTSTITRGGGNNSNGSSNSSGSASALTSHGDQQRLKPCAIGQAVSNANATPSDNNNRTTSKVSVNRSSEKVVSKTGSSSSNGGNNNSSVNIPSDVSCDKPKHVIKGSGGGEKALPGGGSGNSEKLSSEKLQCRRDSTGSSPRGEPIVKLRRNSDVTRRLEDVSDSSSNHSSDSHNNAASHHERRHHHERLEKEKQEKERLEKEKLERERLEREQELEKERLEKEKQEREARRAKEREEREKREREDRERREREERERREREQREEQEERERKEKEQRQERKRLEEEKKQQQQQPHAKDEPQQHDNTKSHNRHHNHDHKNTKEDNNSSSGGKRDEFRKDSSTTHESSRSHEKTRHHIDRDAERRKDSIKENRDNNIHDKQKDQQQLLVHNKDNKLVESRHLSIDFEKSGSGKSYDIAKNLDPSKRKERNNSLPANLGKRRLSAHEFDDDAKRLKLDHGGKKLSERRDSKDSTRSDKSKHKNNSISGSKYEESGTTKSSSRDKHREDRHKSRKLDKHKVKSKSHEKEPPRDSPPAAPPVVAKELTDKDFLARLDLRSNEDIQKQKKEEAKKTENSKKEKHGGVALPVLSDKIKSEKPSQSGVVIEQKCVKKDDRQQLHQHQQLQQQQQQTPQQQQQQQQQLHQQQQQQQQQRIRKLTQNSSDSDSDEPKKHSIFDIVDDEPAYISMYDKVKARSCKNMQKQEEEKRQEKIKAKFSQLKQSRAKREEKKRSTSWDEDSDSDHDGRLHDTKKRGNKMCIIMSSDDDESQHRKLKKRDISTDSDSERRQIKSEQAETSDDDRVRSKTPKCPKSKITSDSSDEETIKKIQNQVIKSEIFSDNEIDQGFADSEENKPFIKDERKKERNNKHQDLNAQIFGDSNSPVMVEQKSFNSSRHSFAETSGDDEIKRNEARKKHKKKQRRQKFDSSIESENRLEEKKHHDKKKQHGKKEKKRDKTKDGEKKKSKKIKDVKLELKRDGSKDLFGSVSEDSEKEKHESEQSDHKSFMERFESESDQEREQLKEEYRKRKERKRRDKERRLQEEEKRLQEEVNENLNENSMDFDNMGKQLEANIKDDSMEGKDEDFARFNDELEKKEDRKDKEKKKKRKKSKEEKDKHHHRHHHDKNKSKELRKDLESDDTKSLPNLLDIPSPKPELESPKTPSPTTKEKKRVLPGFGELDEKIHENAVKSISDFEEVKEVKNLPKEVKSDKPVEGGEEKRVIISQEETEDAVAALLGESFGGGGQFEDYEEDINTSNDQTASLVEEGIVAQDDEEMRQAVQSLGSADIDVKPETPQSEHELQIDTDTEENEDNSIRFDQPPKTPEITPEALRRPKTPDIPAYFRKTPSSPPSLTPIKPAVIIEDKSEDKTKSLSLPILPEQPRTVISQTWNVDKKVDKPIEKPKIPLRTYGSVVKIAEPVYPPLTAITKQEHPQLTSIEKKQQQQPVATSSPPVLHSLEPAKVPTSPRNRLPITPVMVSKPLQATTVLLPQAKIAHSLEPPVLVSASDPKPHDRPPRMVFQTATTTMTPAQFTNFVQGQPRMVVQTVRPPQGLLVPSRQLPPTTFGYLNQSPYPGITPIVAQSKITPPQNSKPTTIIVPTTTSNQKPFMPVIKETPVKEVVEADEAKPVVQNHASPKSPVALSHSQVQSMASFQPHVQSYKPSPIIQTYSNLGPLQSTGSVLSHGLIQSVAAQKPPPPQPEPKVAEPVKPVEPISTPSPVIVQAPAAVAPVAEAVEQPPKSAPESPKQSAIEKVTEELNLTLKKEDLPKEEVVVVVEAAKPTPVMIEEEKAETDSVVSDTSKERSSAEIKDDPMDSKEDSDYWSAKEVNIDSVIKTLCSADEMSDHSSVKDDWIDESKQSPKKEEELEEPEESAKNVRRTGRTRGRKGRGGGTASGVQTRRSKQQVTATPAPPPAPTKRGRPGRPRSERKSSKSESEMSADVYEFRDDSDESNKERPRLILTIKSPAQTPQAVVKEVVKEVAPPSPAKPVKAATPPPKETPITTKEEFISPVTTNTRKSRRLQERDIRNTVDDTIEDVVKNTVLTRNAAKRGKNAKPETPRKSPRGAKKKDRRASEASSEEEKVVEEMKVEELPKQTVPVEKPKEEEEKPKVEIKQKPHEGLKAVMLRRVKGDGIIQEPMTLIDPVTGLLTPMRECEEGRYIPLPGGGKGPAPALPAVSEQQKSVIAPPPKPKPLSLKAHVLSAMQQQQQKESPPPPPPVVQQPPPPPQPVVVQPQVITKPVVQTPIRPSVPVNQNLNVNVSLANYPQSQHLSPRPNVVKPSQMSPVLTSQQKQQIMAQASKVVTKSPSVVTTSIIQQQQQQQMLNSHLKQPQLKQQPVVVTTPAKIPPKVHASPVKGPMQGHVPSSQGGRIMPPHPKGVMEPPKIDVSMPNIILGPRSNLSPQGRVAGLPFEASLHGERNLYNRSRSPPPAHQNSPSPQGPEAMPQFPPGSVPLRPPLPPAHYMHPSQVMQFQQYLRQPYHLPRSPMVPGGMDKPGDGQEGEEAPVTSPPLELRRSASAGLALSGRTVVVSHGLHSPHERATDSPQVYNMHSARMQHFHSTNRYYDQPTEPPPAHRPLTSHGSLAALGNERSMASHMASLASERPLGGHLQPDRPLSSHSALAAHMGGLGAPERPLSNPHAMTIGAGLGAAGNLMGAVTRHLGVDAPTTQRGLQAATPPHASQVPPQAESLYMLLKQYPCMWQGLLALKNDQAAVQMYFVSGNQGVAKYSLPKNTDGSTPPLRIFQRMRLEPQQVEGVARKMQMENEHCMLLALPCGHDHVDVLKQSTNLTNGFITYLQQKQAAGIVNVAAPGTTQPPAYVVHIFPSCDFVNENLRRIAPSLLERVADIAHLLIVITTV